MAKFDIESSCAEQGREREREGKRERGIEAELMAFAYLHFYLPFG